MVNGLYGSVFAKVNSDSVAHDGGPVDCLTDCNGLGIGGEGTDDSAKGLEGRPGYNGSMTGDYCLEVLKGFRVKGFGVL